MDELFPVWRHHAVLTDSPVELVQAEGQHRGHAIVEQVFADVTSGPARAPAIRRISPRTPPGCRSRRWPTTCCARPAPWPACAFAKARAATIRRDLIAVAARTARHGRGHLVLHLPEGWHREREWLNLWDAACGPPAAAA